MVDLFRSEGRVAIHCGRCPPHRQWVQDPSRVVDIAGEDIRQLDHQRDHHDHIDDHHDRASDDLDFAGDDGRAIHVQLDNEHGHPHDVISHMQK